MNGVDNALEWGTQGNDRGPYVTMIGQGSAMGAGLDAAAFYVETDNGSYEINNTSMYIRGGTLLGSHGSTSLGWTYIRSIDFQDPDGNSIIGAPDKRISDQDIANWNAGTGGGDDGFSGDYNDLVNKPTIPTNNNQLTNGAGYITSSSLSPYATTSWVSSNYQPKGNYLTSFTESDPTVPPHVKSISTSDINRWNNPPSGGGSDTFDDVLKGVRLVPSAHQPPTGSA